MRKLIITSIFIFTTLNAFAADCIQSIFNNIKSHDIAIFNGIAIDSIYHHYSDTTHLWEYDNQKYHWTGEHLDSITYYTKWNFSGEWQITVAQDLDSIHTDITQEGNFTHIIITNAFPSTDELVYVEKDSVNRVLTFLDSNYDNTPQETAYVLRKDTIFIKEISKGNSSIIVRDSTNENKCYEKAGKSNDYSDIQMIYEYETRGDTLIETQTRLGDDPSTYKTFLVPVNKLSPIITRRNRPTIKLQKAKPFDLLGRPAKGKYTVKVLK